VIAIARAPSHGFGMGFLDKEDLSRSLSGVCLWVGNQKLQKNSLIAIELAPGPDSNQRPTG
jgi:hypothetical protein